jgi:hypothetical protein
MPMQTLRPQLADSERTHLSQVRPVLEQEVESTTIPAPCSVCPDRSTSATQAGVGVQFVDPLRDLPGGRPYLHQQFELEGY